MTINYVYPSWESIENDCLSMHAQMKSNGYEPDVIIGLLRGGVIPARIFMDFYDVSLDFCSLDVKLYDGINSRRDKPVIKDFLGDNINGKSVLICDDIYESGKTMSAVLEYLKPRNVKITTATVYWKTPSLFMSRDIVNKPDYYARIAQEGSWICFPWEKYEFWKLINEKK